MQRVTIDFSVLLKGPSEEPKNYGTLIDNGNFSWHFNLISHYFLIRNRFLPIVMVNDVML